MQLVVFQYCGMLTETLNTVLSYDTQDTHTDTVSLKHSRMHKKSPPAKTYNIQSWLTLIFDLSLRESSKQVMVFFLMSKNVQDSRRDSISVFTHIHQRRHAERIFFK